MFVSTPPQISADAAQTGFIGPSVPASAGSDGGFAAWLPNSAQPAGEVAGPLAALLANGDTNPQPPFLPFGPEPASSATGQLNQGTSQSTLVSGSQRGFGVQAELLQQATAHRQAGAHSNAQPKPATNPLTGQQATIQSGAETSLMSDHRSGAVTPSAATAADGAETNLNRMGLAAMAKPVAGPLAKPGSAGSSPATDPFAGGSRANADTSSQSQPQLAALSQATETGFKTQPSQGQILGQNAAQSSGQDGAGRLNPTINSADIAVQMARGKADGSNQFTIRLTPESMGTITVKLNIADNASLTAQLQVEKPETLALLQKDLAGLEKALKAQGFTTGDGDLTIALKASSIAVRGGEASANSTFDQRFGQGQNSAQSQNQPGTQNQPGVQSQGSGSAAQQAPSQAPQSGGLDRPTPGMLLSSGDQGFQQSHHENGAHGQEGFEQNPNGYPDPELEELDAGQLEHADLIANAYHGQSLLTGMSTQLDLSV